MKIVLMHPTGNQFVRALLQSLNKEELLIEFETAIAMNSNSTWIKYLPNEMRQECLRRSYDISPEKIWTHGLLETARLILPKMKLNKYVNHEHGFASTYSVYKNFDKAAAKRLAKIAHKNKINAVYAYEDGALTTFKQAKELGIKCIYDLPIAYWETGRKLLTEEAARLPKWAKTLGGGILDSQEKLERKTQEMEMADVVIVPGEFVMSSIPKWAQGKKIIMAPFGSPLIKNNDQTHKKTTSTPLRVLFAGSMGQRKGLGDLFAALKLINRKDIELIVMGSLLESMEFYRSEYPNFIYEPGRPHDAVLALMRSCDVFCLPSIIEGRALVMQEAMSQGLPLIITRNTGGEDLIIEGETGFLVPIRSPEAIAEKLNWFLENRSKVAEMGEMARTHAARYTWKNYGSTIIDSLREYMI
jgi:glycosyltransferase involved in cell wall biosynthesis